MRRRGWSLLLMAVLIVGLAACSGDREAEPAETETPAVEQTTQAESATAEKPEATVEEPAEEPASAIEQEPVGPAGAFIGAQSALEQLESYRYTTYFTFTGEEEGEIESGSIELTGVVAAPNRKHLIWHDLEADERFEVIQIEDEAWILDEEGWQDAPVMVAEAMSQAVLIYAPSVAWSGIFGELEPTATYVGQETINGVSAHHYTSTYARWGGYWAGELENASGDVWIAEAGYPVRYDFTAAGADEDGNRGTVSWRMDLTDVNADITIDPPISTSD